RPTTRDDGGTLKRGKACEFAGRLIILIQMFLRRVFGPCHQKDTDQSLSDVIFVLVYPDRIPDAETFASLSTHP
ncbi:MAG TPA: hypothetical protein VIL90_05605, partial [Puia sp.]